MLYKLLKILFRGLLIVLLLVSFTWYVIFLEYDPVFIEKHHKCDIVGGKLLNTADHEYVCISTEHLIDIDDVEVKIKRLG